MVLVGNSRTCAFWLMCVRMNEPVTVLSVAVCIHCHARLPAALAPFQMLVSLPGDTDLSYS